MNQVGTSSRPTPTDPRIAGIILAAGRSSRMGSPKALLTYDGETFLARLVRILSTVCDPVIVVLGHHAEALRAHVPPPAKAVVNPDPDRGQLSSLQTALNALPENAAGFAFIPVDCPAVSLDTVHQLARTFLARDPETQFVIPRGPHGKKKVARGHPVFASPAIAREMLSLKPTDEARTIVHAHVPETQYVDVTDPGIFTDIDTPEAYKALTKS